MTSINLSQGLYNVSFEKGSVLLTPLLEGNRESFVPSSQPSHRQFPIIRQPSAHLYTSALGLAGGIGLVVSCVWSILLPAIGSIGVIGIACLLRRKIVSLNSNELSPATNKTHNLFQGKVVSNAEDSLDNIDSSPINPTVSNDINDSDNESDEDFEIDSDPELDMINQPDNFLVQFQSYIIQKNVLNCENLRTAFSTAGYETYFLPKQLLEELLFTYQSIQSDDFKGIKNKDSKTLRTYVQDKIRFIQQELQKAPYQQDPNQEQKDFMEIIHKQLEKEQWNVTDGSDMDKFLDKKMDLIGTFYEVLSRCANLDQGIKEHFAEKANNAYAHALYFRGKHLK